MTEIHFQLAAPRLASFSSFYHCISSNALSLNYPQITVLEYPKAAAAAAGGDDDDSFGTAWKKEDDDVHDYPFLWILVLSAMAQQWQQLW